MVEMGNVWDRTAEFVSDNLASILPIALLTILLPAMISTNVWAAMAGGSVSARIVMVLVMLALALVSSWGQLVLVAMALEHGSDRDARALATRRLPVAILVAVIATLATALLFVPSWAMLRSAGVPLENGMPGAQRLLAGLNWPLACYVALVMLLLLWLVARFAVLTPVIVNEQGWIGTFARSFRLTRGVTLKVIGVLLLYWIVSSVAQLAARLVFGSIFRLVAGGGEGLSLSAVLTAIAVAIVQTIFVVLAAIFMTKLYQALVHVHADHA